MRWESLTMYDTVCYSQQAQWRTISGVSAKYVGVGPKKEPEGR